MSSLSSYFASWIPQLTKLLDGWFLLWFSSLHPRLALAKGYEAPKLSFFMNLSFTLLCHELYKDLPHSWIALVVKKLSKTLNFNTIWLEMIARVLSMPIELKGNNYYSKVFKRVIYKLWNNTFWVVITPPNRHIASSLAMKERKNKNKSNKFKIMLITPKNV